MKTDDFYYLGMITKTFGYEGALIAFLEVDDPLQYENLESVFILIEGKRIPFFIKDLTFRANPEEVVIRFEEIDSLEEARNYCEREMYLPLNRLPSLEEEDDAFYFHDLYGYKAYHASGDYLGIIEQVLEYPGNPVFEIKKEDRELLIPVTDEFIHHLDHAQKAIYFDPPEGLLDLFR